MQYILLEDLGVWDIRTVKVRLLRGLVSVICHMKSLHKGSGRRHLSHVQFTQSVCPNDHIIFVRLVTGTKKKLFEIVVKSLACFDTQFTVKESFKLFFAIKVKNTWQ